MGMMIVTKEKGIETWINNLKKLNTDVEIEVYPEVKDKDKITFALVWSKLDIDFTEFKNLKCIASMGAGVDHILSNNTISKNVYITKVVDDKLVSSMWEYLLCTVLNILTNHYKYIAQQKESKWEQLELNSIENYTIGFMGLGQLGGEISKRFNNFGFTVKGFSNSKKQIKSIETFTNLDEFLNGVDILINLLPLTDGTKGILNKDLFYKLNKNAYVINVGRGSHLVEEDLLEALDSKHLSGAILDVFEKEPLPKENKLWSHPNIIVTPHSASLTDSNSVSKQIIENYKRVSENLIPYNIIDRDKGY
ncbi:2-hydroxyacid dehydrogenase [Campylobacterota bacterium DY0563]